MKVKSFHHLNKWLRGPMKPRIMTSVELYSAMSNYQPDLSELNFYRTAKDLYDLGSIQRIKKGLYANMLALPLVSQAEIASALVPKAVISLHSALMQAGVANNPSSICFSVVPTASDEWNSLPNKNIEHDYFGLYIFYHLPANIVEPKGIPQHYLVAPDNHAAMATKEKALLDWIYIAQSSRTRQDILGGLPPLDLDMSEFKMHRLKRMANAMHIKDELDDWLKVKSDYDNDASVKANSYVA